MALADFIYSLSFLIVFLLACYAAKAFRSSPGLHDDMCTEVIAADGFEL